MPAASLIESLIWQWTSQPVHDRFVYRIVRRMRPTRIVELGVDRGPRSTRLLRIALRYAASPIHYTGVDAFESRPDQDGLSLKEAYQRIGKLGLRARLLPGQPGHTVPQIANHLAKSDLIVVSPSIDESAFSDTWAFWPRMLHEKSLVLCFRDTGFQVLTVADIDARARQHSGARRAA